MSTQIKEPELIFLLRDKKAERSMIYYGVRFERELLFRLSTGVYVKPVQWSTRKKSCIISTEWTEIDNYNNKEANKKLQLLKDQFTALLENFSGEISNFRAEIIDKMGRKKKLVVEVTAASLINLYKKNILSDSTKASYYSTVKLLEEFIISEKEQRTWKNVASRGFMLRFRTYLVQSGKYSVSSVNNALLRTGAIFKNLVDKGIITNSQHIDLRVQPLKNSKQAQNQPFLYENEVQQLLRLKLDKESEIMARDLFCISCMTGQRISDIKKVTLSELGGVYYYDLITQKTASVVRAKVIFNECLDLLKKYSGKELKVSSTINTMLKSIAARAGLTRKWNQVKHSAGESKPDVKEVEISDIIHFHTARHTFDSILLLRGYSVQDISNLTGHDVEMVKSYTSAVQPLDFSISSTLKPHEKLSLVGDPVPEEPAPEEHKKRGRKKLYDYFWIELQKRD